jgi:7,8-dihydropterin-6-yl-methyl-4-(beta-D-ribofuranosyl)aminobenzene 5'-phosphate synthase
MSLGNNARSLGVELTDIDRVILSHGHYDHTGGLPQVLYPPREVEIIAHPDIFDHKYALIEHEGRPYPYYIGIRFSREYLEHNLQARFQWQTAYTEIVPGIMYSGEVPRQTDFEYPDTRLQVKRNNQFELDPLKDDISLLIETDQGPVVLLGCAHAGVINVMKHFEAQTGHHQFHAVIGGTHLGFLSHKDQLERTIEAFESYQLQLVGVSHCTGQTAAAVCYSHFKERFAFAHAGWSSTF